MRARLGYLHVPKAAGSSVTDALRRAIVDAATVEHRPISVCPQVMDRSLYGTFDRFGEISAKRRAMVHTGSPDALAAYDAVIGHFCAPNLEVGRDVSDLVVLLREPRARLASHYAYWRGWTEAEHAGWDPYDGSRRAAREEWPEFLADPAVASQIDNVAARLLLGPNPLIPPDGFIAGEHVEELTAQSSAVLDRLGHVDAIEHGEGCWRRLQTWVGLRLSIGHLNATESESGAAIDWSPASSRSAIELLASRTRIDRELWMQAMASHAPKLSRSQLSVIADEIAVSRRPELLAAGPRERALRAISRTRAGARWRAGSAWRRVARRRDQ